MAILNLPTPKPAKAAAGAEPEGAPKADTSAKAAAVPKADTRAKAAAAPEPIVLSAESVELIGRELDAIRDRVVADLGTADRDYILRVVRTQRRLELAGQIGRASCRERV